LTSVSAVTSSAAALAIGYVGDRIGQKRVLMACMLGVAAVSIPQAYVATAAQLAVLRAVHGAFVGGIMPTANALLAKSTPRERRGSMLGLSAGAQSGGRALGPTLGAAAAAAWGMGSTFLIVGGVFLLLAVLAERFVHGAQEEAAPALAVALAGAPDDAVPTAEAAREG